MYEKVYNSRTNELVAIKDGNRSIGINPQSRFYQEVLDAIIEQGADCFDGDIPEDLQAAADAKLAAGLYQPDPHA